MVEVIGLDRPDYPAGNSDWVAPVLFLLRLLRLLWRFRLVECRGENATGRGQGTSRKTQLLNRFIQFDPNLVGIGTTTVP